MSEIANPKTICKTYRVQLPAGASKVDLYLPESAAPAPLVIIAHGFMRRRHSMSGWGQRLAQAGLIAAAPDLPTRADHLRNARYLSELKAQLCQADPQRPAVDPLRVGLMGFSAGGLESLLAAATNPDLAIWVGLDPVDWKDAGTKAAPQVKCPAVVLTAEASACNAQGNARSIIAALPRCEHTRIPGAVHVDAEWPTDWMAEIVCGRSKEQQRSEFRRLATAALLAALASQPG
jgi:dienelactone hydrolase